MAIDIKAKGIAQFLYLIIVRVVCILSKVNLYQIVIL
jgi:hypothetical protein